MQARFTRLTGDVGNVTGLMRLKRLGKIRLGIKKKHAQTGREYPSAIDQDGQPIDYFVIPPEITDVTGEKPKVLDAMFVSNDPEEVYQEKLAMYGSATGLKCHGNGQTAMRRNEAGQWEPHTCPCPNLKTDANPKGSCTAQGHLMVVLPAVSMWGYFQITTHSLYARAGILSSLKQLQNTVGRIAYIPLKLSRAPQDIVHDGKAKTHYIVGFVPALTLPQIIDLRTKPELMVLPAQYQIEPPIDTNPADDPADVEVGREAEDDEGIDAAKLAEADETELKTIQDKLNAQRQKKAPENKTQKDVVGGASKTRSMEPHAATPQHTTDASAPLSKQAKPTQAPTTPDHANGTLISQGPWSDIVAYIDSHADLVALKQDWKTKHSVDNVQKLTAGGQQSFLQFMREAVGPSFPY